MYISYISFISFSRIELCGLLLGGNKKSERSVLGEWWELGPKIDIRYRGMFAMKCVIHRDFVMRVSPLFHTVRLKKQKEKNIYLVVRDEHRKCYWNKSF